MNFDCLFEPCHDNTIYTNYQINIFKHEEKSVETEYLSELTWLKKSLSKNEWKTDLPDWQMDMVQT